MIARPLERKVAVVTGAANGIGLASALRLARDGASVALLDMDETALQIAAEELRAYGQQALPIPLDCTDPRRVPTAFKSIRNDLGPVDILLNNVGQSARERMSEFSRSDLATLDLLLDVNLKSCIFCSRQVVDDMRQRRSGKIINMTSESAVNGSPRCWDYSAAKAGVIGFTRAVARELAPFNINVNAIGPGPVRTRALDRLPTSLLETIVSGIPMGRVGEPEEIANAVAFFASAQSDFITGQTLLVNGGNWML
jgi:NAD(P)-dependent dehydrogenase (short-subunit alcohol dehydrogenase family)